MRVAKWCVSRMPLIGRVWKANVNVWKRHITLQLVFNHGECMMHVDKNADGHVVDQNMDWISREIAYVPLSGRIRSKRSSCMQPFFFFFWKKMSTRHAYQWFDGFKVLDMLPRGPWIWNLDMLPRGPMNWSFDMLPRGPMDWNLGCASQRSKDWILDVLPRGPWIWIWTCF